MANVKLSELDEITAVTDDDLILTTNDPAGTPVSKKVTVANLRAAITGEVLGGTRLVSGGAAVWVSGYTYRVSAATYYIEDVFYTSSEAEITLDAADATNDRIDVIALNTSSGLSKITGTAAADPMLPDIDPASYVMVTFIYVTASSTEPESGNTDIYAENAEWTVTASAGTIVSNSESNPRTDTYCIEGTAVAANTYFTAVKAAAMAMTGQDALVFYIRIKAAWDKRKTIKIQFMSSATVNVGTGVTVANGTYGFNSTSTAIDTYQQVVVPVADFAIPSGTSIDRVRVTFLGTGTNIGFHMDDVFLQASAPTSITNNYYLTINPRGDWVSTANYAVGDTVMVGGYAYLCTVSNTNRSPSTSSGYWSLMSKPPVIYGGVGIGFEAAALPAASATYSLICPYTMTVPADCSGSTFYNAANPTAQAVISIKKNGTEFATCTVSTGGSGTFSSSATDIAAGDRISFVFPASQDATMAGVALTIKGTRMV